MSVQHHIRHAVRHAARPGGWLHKHPVLTFALLAIGGATVVEGVKKGVFSKAAPTMQPPAVL